MHSSFFCLLLFNCGFLKSLCGTRCFFLNRYVFSLYMQFFFHHMFLQMFADLRCSPSCTRAGVHGTVSICPPDCFQYKGTLDVFYKIIRQVGLLCLSIIRPIRRCYSFQVLVQSHLHVSVHQCKIIRICLTVCEVFTGRVCKAMERHKCRPSTGCTNCEFLGDLRLCFVFCFYQKCQTH